MSSVDTYFDLGLTKLVEPIISEDGSRVSYYDRPTHTRLTCTKPYVCQLGVVEAAAVRVCAEIEGLDEVHPAVLHAVTMAYVPWCKQEIVKMLAEIEATEGPLGE